MKRVEEVGAEEERDNIKRNKLVRREASLLDDTDDLSLFSSLDVIVTLDDCLDRVVEVKIIL